MRLLGASKFIISYTRRDHLSIHGVYFTPPNLKKVEWKFWEFDSSKGSSVYSQEEVSNDDDIWASEIL